MTEQAFENIKYRIYPQISDSDDLYIEYEHRLFTKLPIDRLTGNIVERLKVSSIKWLFDNIIYKSYPLNDDYGDIYFGSDVSLITRLWLYCINCDIIFMLNNGLRI